MENVPEETFPAAQREADKVVFSAADLSRLHLYSLILSAAAIPHHIGAGGNRAGWVIRVAAADYARAIAEIHAYDEENSSWPSPSPDPDTFMPVFRVQAVLIVASLSLFYGVTGPWSPHAQWFIHGAVDSARILTDGEYYRLVTALTLHADLVHLLGNCFLGGFLLHFYFLLLGNGIGLSALVFSAVLANYINVLAHGPGHFSVGFSTAVFSAIGILSALNYRHYHFTQPARLVLPLMAGAAMLAMLGSGSEHTDLGAHFFGLMTGLLAGSLLGIKSVFRLRDNFRLQLLLTISAMALPLLAWLMANH